jgi:hypothetical protein
MGIDTTKPNMLVLMKTTLAKIFGRKDTIISMVASNQMVVKRGIMFKGMLGIDGLETISGMMRSKM